MLLKHYVLKAYLYFCKCKGTQNNVFSTINMLFSAVFSTKKKQCVRNCFMKMHRYDGHIFLYFVLSFSWIMLSLWLNQ